MVGRGLTAPQGESTRIQPLVIRGLTDSRTWWTWETPTDTLPRLGPMNPPSPIPYFPVSLQYSDHIRTELLTVSAKKKELAGLKDVVRGLGEKAKEAIRRQTTKVVKVNGK
jgi:hypothetical protein